MRLIDADALLELLEAWKDESQKRGAEINYKFASAIISQVNAMPTIESEPHYCRECKWSRCRINVDKYGNTETYWHCFNWDGGTDEEGYCYEWERRTDEGSD